jgi:hypothetical protein
MVKRKKDTHFMGLGKVWSNTGNQSVFTLTSVRGTD